MMYFLSIQMRAKSPEAEKLLWSHHLKVKNKKNFFVTLCNNLGLTLNFG